MERLKSQILTDSKEFQEKRERYSDLLKDYYDILSKVMKAGGDEPVKRHKRRGKLLARERIDLLVDPNTPFLELSTLASINQYDNNFPSAGIITGIGSVKGHLCVIVANDATVKGGTYIVETIKKHLRAQEIALQNKLSCVYLVDSGGVFLPEQASVFPDKTDFGRIFFNQAQLSAQGIPQIAVVMGSSTAGGAYIPAMCDETIIVRHKGTIFLGGPPLVKAATGEEVSVEELGGAEMHASISGVVDHLAENDQHALNICRDIFQNIPQKISNYPDRVNFSEPLYPIEELYGLLPLTTRETVDAHEILARIIDGSEFAEFKANYGKTLVTGFARIMGISVGIIINNGILYSESALKGTHFIELCNYRKIPIIFLQNITGFMVGKKYEQSGIAKDGAKMVHAVSVANVPKITVIFGGSYGAGNYAMAGRAFDPRFLFMYPNSKISVMGGEQAANVLTTVKEDQLKKSGKKLSGSEIDIIKKTIIEKYEEEGSAYYSTSRLWDDGIIDPTQTRTVLAMALAVSLNTEIDEPRSGIYRM